MTRKFNYDVFLSHSSIDKGCVLKIAETLKAEGLRVWYDEWAIPDGGDILHEIEKGIQESRVNVLCISPDALKSDWVTMERTTAQFRDPANKNRRVIPLLLAPCDELPDSLTRIKYIKYYENNTSAISQLKNACEHADSGHLEPAELKAVKISGILFVDDEEKTRKVFCKQFEGDYPIFLSASVEEAHLLLKVKHKEIAIAIVDQRLSRRKGTDLLGYIRKTYPRILRILMSAYTDFDSMTDAINIAQVHGYIYKPWEVSHLRVCVDSALDAFWASEMAPTFYLPITPSKSDDASLLVKSHNQLSPSKVSHTDAKTSGVFEELEMQRELLRVKDKQISELLEKRDNIKPKVELQSKPETVATSIPVGVMMSHSIKPTVSSIIVELKLIGSMLDYDQLGGFWLFKDKKALRVSRVVAKIVQDLSMFAEGEPLSQQVNTITALNSLRNLISEALDVDHVTHKIMARSIGANTSIQKISRHFAVLVNYLGLKS